MLGERIKGLEAAAAACEDAGKGLLDVDPDWDAGHLLMGVSEALLATAQDLAALFSPLRLGVPMPDESPLHRWQVVRESRYLHGADAKLMGRLKDGMMAGSDEGWPREYDRDDG